MRYSTILFAGILSILLSIGTAFGQSKNTDDSQIALNGYSPVSYLDLGLAQRGSKAFKSEYDGLKYYFTDADQKAAFDANPDKYLPQFGGWCATGIAVGAKFRTDPHKFLVRNDKLYLFLYDLEVDAKQLWLKDEKTMSKNANENWKEKFSGK
ncbi:MAG: YHS domain-containing (seleno)protein [Bacteroidota bacterium]